MVATHTIKKDSRWYHAGEEINFIDNFINATNKEKISYTKTEINRMSKAELQELALSSGIKGAENMTGGELKEYFINVFKL